MKQQRDVKTLFLPSIPAINKRSLFSLQTPKVISTLRNSGYISVFLNSSSCAHAKATKILSESDAAIMAAEQIEEIAIDIENEIKTIHMGDKGPNLLSVERANEIISELKKNDCKAVIILGNEKVFSAGLNLKHLQKAKEASEVSLIFKTLRELLVASRKFPGPVISIVSGHAIAGGCLLALASDFRYGVHGMHRMGLNEMAVSYTNLRAHETSLNIV